jgi:hypothetical protein
LADPGENLLNIGIADALRTALRPQDAFYVKDVYPVYPFPGLNYGYALVAELSGLSSVFVFEKMRFLWTLTATAALFVGVRALSGGVSYAYLPLLGGAVLILTGPFGQILEFYWGQLGEDEPRSGRRDECHCADRPFLLVPLAFAVRT